MLSRNRLSNTQNLYQGDFKRVLCVCSAGLLRSPTIAWVLSNPPFNYNTRAVGCNAEYGFIQLDAYQLFWAEEVVCADKEHAVAVNKILDENPQTFLSCRPKVISLDIPDDFGYRDPHVVELVPKVYSRLAGLKNE